MRFKVKSDAPAGVIADAFDVFTTQMGNWALQAVITQAQAVRPKLIAERVILCARFPKLGQVMRENLLPL